SACERPPPAAASRRRSAGGLLKLRTKGRRDGDQCRSHNTTAALRRRCRCDHQHACSHSVHGGRSRSLSTEVTMNLAIKLSPAERIRRALEADPSLTHDDLKQLLGVTQG